MKAGSSNNSPTAANGASPPQASQNNSATLAQSPAPPNTTIGHYIIGKLNLIILLGKALGKGTFGQVKQATHILTGEKVNLFPFNEIRLP